MKPTKMYNTELVLQAACAAQRFNGAYVKEDETKFHKPNHQPTKWIVTKASNKSLVYFLVTGNLPSYGHHPQRYDFLENCNIKITMDDKCLAEDIKLHFQGKLFEALGGKLNEYVENIWKTLDTEEVPAYGVGLLCSTPSAYERDAKKEIIEDTVLENCANEYIGSVNDKIEGSVKLINVFYSKNYESFIYTGIYENKFLVNFWNGKELGETNEVIDIKAKIKRLGLSKFYKGAWETSLNYVKKIDDKKELTKEEAFGAIVEGLNILSGDKK